MHLFLKLTNLIANNCIKLLLLTSEQNLCEMALVKNAARNGAVCYHHDSKEIFVLLCLFLPQGPTLYKRERQNTLRVVFSNAAQTRPQRGQLASNTFEWHQLKVRPWRIHKPWSYIYCNVARRSLAMKTNQLLPPWNYKVRRFTTRIIFKLDAS